jgi:hypothetical protein
MEKFKFENDAKTNSDVDNSSLANAARISMGWR